MMLCVRRSVLILVLLALVTAASPAAAQEDPVAPTDPEPSLAQNATGPCLPVGLALAVLSSDGTVADILPANEVDDTTAAGGRTIILNGPGVVGPCAQFQGYWGPQGAGAALSKLMLYQYGATTGASVDGRKLVGRDGLEVKRRGPTRHAARLGAYTKLEKTGKYRFVAEFSVAATQADSTGAAGKTVEESLRVPFVVEVREKAERKTGAVEGFVYAVREGERQPVAGAVVRIASAVPASVRGDADLSTVVQFGSRELWRDSELQDEIDSRAYSLSALSMRARAVDGKAISREWALATRLAQEGCLQGLSATTDEKGHYRIEATAGAYIVMAKARGYEVQFYDGKPSRSDADRVRVAAGKTTGPINFKLASGEAVKPPESPEDPEYGAITGHVGGEGSSDLLGAIVVAVPARRSSEPDPGLLGDTDPDPNKKTELTARTDEQGIYKMKAPEGAYYVYAYAEGYARQWYLLKANAETADVVKVQSQAVTKGVDFRLAAARSPEDPDPNDPELYGVISGTVYGPDGPLAGSAFVVALLPSNEDTPPEQSPVLDEPAPGLEPERPIARTDESGRYKLRVPVGKWVVRAEAEGFAPQVYRKHEDSDAPTVFAIRGGEEWGGIDFKLSPAERTAITGRVLKKGTDDPVGGAVVWALARPTLVPGREVEPRLQARALTEEDGTYVLLVPAGTYAVGVVIHPELSDPDTAALWWDNKRSLNEADLITLADGAVVADIDFAIARTREVP